MKEDYREYSVGEDLIIVDNPDNPIQNGERVTVHRIIEDGTTMYCRFEGDATPASFRRTRFRKLTKLDKALK